MPDDAAGVHDGLADEYPLASAGVDDDALAERSEVYPQHFGHGGGGGFGAQRAGERAQALVFLLQRLVTQQPQVQQRLLFTEGKVFFQQTVACGEGGSQPGTSRYGRMHQPAQWPGDGGDGRADADEMVLLLVGDHERERGHGHDGGPETRGGAPRGA